MTMSQQPLSLPALPSHNRRFGVIKDGMTGENLRVDERFMRTRPDTIMCWATVDDPTVYTHPWTIEESLTQSPARCLNMPAAKAITG
jgi:hypothetical protein